MGGVTIREAVVEVTSPPETDESGSDRTDMKTS